MRVPSASSIPTRAWHMKHQLDQQAAGQTVNLIAHSMGGLDGRYMITHLNPTRFNVQSLTTIATPHRGSPFMDWCRDSLGVGQKTDENDLDGLLTKNGASPHPHQTANNQLKEYINSQLQFNSRDQDGNESGPHPFIRRIFTHLDAPAFRNLTTDYMQNTFNKLTPDVPGVFYSSYAAVSEVPVYAALHFSHQIVKRKEGPNDGLVSLKSAVWGNFMGTLNGDHWDLVPRKLRRAVQFVPIASKDFDSIEFYLGAVTRLHDQGF